MWWLGDTDAWITLGSVEERLRLLLNKEVAEIAVYSENGETLAPFFFFCNEQNAKKQVICSVCISLLWDYGWNSWG